MGSHWEAFFNLVVAFSIISSMCVRLSHRKLHDGECLVLYAATSTEATDGSGLSLAAMQQLAPIIIAEKKTLSLTALTYTQPNSSGFIHVMKNWKS